jgi:hypothetical protein
MGSGAEAAQTYDLSLPSGRVEHVTLESRDDLSAENRRQPRTSAVRTCAFKTIARRQTTELAILDSHALEVHQTGPNGYNAEYQVDLRFLDSSPVWVRSIPWGWLRAAIVLLIAGPATVGFVWQAESTPVALLVAAVLATALGAACLARTVRETRTSLHFVSIDGRGPVVCVPGGLLTANIDQAFLDEVARATEAARLAWPQPKQQFLRDQMREHRRLYQIGVLAEADYEQSKARILAAH